MTYGDPSFGATVPVGLASYVTLTTDVVIRTVVDSSRLFVLKIPADSSRLFVLTLLRVDGNVINDVGASVSEDDVPCAVGGEAGSGIVVDVSPCCVLGGTGRNLVVAASLDAGSTVGWRGDNELLPVVVGVPSEVVLIAILLRVQLI